MHFYQNHKINLKIAYHYHMIIKPNKFSTALSKQKTNKIVFRKKV